LWSWFLEVKKGARVVEMMMEHFWKQTGRCDGRLLKLFEVATFNAPPSSLMDSNVSSNWKQRKSKELGHIPWLIALWRGRRACWSSGMGVGRVTSINYSHEHAQNQHKGLVHSWSTFGVRTSHG
jgi:hypothetical protein